MKVALAQINPTVGDFSGNWKLIQKNLDRAEKRGASLCIFPEMTTTGCPPHDLLLQDRFVRDNLALLDELVRHTTRMGVVIGYVRPCSSVAGFRLHNVAAVLGNGEILSTHVKTRLSTYDTYDENRYFDAGDSVKVVRFGEVTLGVMICGEILLPSAPSPTGFTERDPIRDAVNLGADIIVKIGAVPYAIERSAEREKQFIGNARAHGRPVVFVNQVGGNDELVYDGNSFVLDTCGRFIAKAKSFEEDLVVVDIDNARPMPSPPARDDIDDVIDALILGTRDFVRKSGYATLVLELSPALDSVVTAVLAAEAVGGENVRALIMPFEPMGDETREVETLARNLGVRCEVLPIDSLYGTFVDPCLSMGEPEVEDGGSIENVATCIRCMLMTTRGAPLDHLVVDTHCKSEIAIGYPTHYCGELSLLGDVPKTVVHRIAERLAAHGAIPETLSKGVETDFAFRLDPSDPGSRTPFTTLDTLLAIIEDHGLNPNIIGALGFDEALVRRLIHLVKTHELKRRKTPLGLKVTARSFGTNRHLPVSHKWRASV